jgi:tyrosyl-tRNA synthetase
MIKIKKGLIKELEWRNLIYDMTPGLDKAFNEGATLYIGIDPTGESLHIGHLMGLVMLKRAVEFGNKAIVIVGGGTSLIGDPSGKDKERPMINGKIIEKNKKLLKKQVSRFIKFDGKEARMIDNVDWLGKVKLIDFLREVGKYMSVTEMMSKDSVKNRLGREQGLSYAEFTYQLLQAYDFLELFGKYNCNVQVGGSDQWGNILQGVELIRKKTGGKVHGLSFPLISDPKTGKKFGKTAEGVAIWLDRNKTHPFNFYQFLVNVSDDLAPELMRFFSFKTKEKIEKIEEEWTKNKGERLLQKELAFELTSLVHGKKMAKQAEKIAEILFNKRTAKLSVSDFNFIKDSLPYLKINVRKELDLVDVLLKLNLTSSKGEGRRLVEQRGVTSVLYHNKFYLIKKGKKDYGVLEVV